ncbi:MAG: response regulator [Phycisphaeraceae bacterium]
MNAPDSKANILLVDDRPGSLLALEAALADLGQNIVKASSGREALKHVLKMEFAVILLDVHMPGLDGFETARLIRQRKQSRHTPIIFVTGYTDELHVAKGYSLGAVDYILAPVVPEVLRAKVGVFVELFCKTQQIADQADSLRRRAEQFQKLAAASIEINAARSVELMLQKITDAARDVVGAHQSITLFLGEHGMGSTKPVAVSSFSDKYAHWRQRTLDLTSVTRTVVARGHTATRLTEAELHEHPDWDVVSKLDIPPVGSGMLAAPLTTHHGKRLGVLYLADAYEGTFTDEDEHILVQLAQKASIAIENILYAEAREANRLKDEFLATLSHELRTPLNAMLGWTRLLRTETPDEAMLNHALAIIERNVNVQTKLIEDLLDISRITSGKLRLDMQPIRIQPVLDAAVDAVRPAADGKSIALTVDAATDVQITGDPDRLQQVLWNLLVNAVKFTPEQGRIEVALTQENHHLQMRISDSGEGISQELLPHIFDRFRQADSTSTRSHGGLGVGLAIVRHIVEMHGGTVHAQSAGAGQGTTFIVRLPLPVVEQTQDQHQPPAVANASPDAEGARQGAAALQGLRILVVDDEHDARELLGQIIARHHGEACIAESAHEAIELMKQQTPDLLISDIAMPGKDVYVLIRNIREQTQRPLCNVPAIALTSYARKEDQDRALSAGFQAHMSKPIEPDELVATVARLSRRSREVVAITTQKNEG